MSVTERPPPQQATSPRLALLLAMAVQADKRFGTIDPERLRPLRG